MRLSVLGPLEVLNNGVPVRLGSGHQRAALGMLTLNANHVVATESLMGALWRGCPPPSAKQMVRKAVAEIRGTLSADCRHSDAPIVVATGNGYLLRIAPERVDLPNFVVLVRQARETMTTGAPARARHLLRQALTMSRGPVLADLVHIGFSWPQLRIAERQRLAAMESLFDTALSRGLHRDIVGDLEALLEQDNPTGRLIGQCMLALYRSARQLDALTVYRKMHAVLAKLDRETCLRLRDLYLAILNQESALDWRPHQTVEPKLLPPTTALEPKRT